MADKLKQNKTNEPSPGDQSSVLVEQFDPAQGRYFDNDSGVRLRVGPGCLHEGQAVGPITVIKDKRFIVESGGGAFLVSTMVDCQPSGAFFQRPLRLEYHIGKEENVKGGDVAGEEREEYLATLQDAYKIFWREKDGERWTALESISFLPDTKRGDSFLEARVDHFSQGALGTKINLNLSVQTERVRIGRPFKGELEFVNGTSRELLFLVVPTGYSDDAISAIGIGLGVGLNSNFGVKGTVKRAIRSSADSVVTVVVPARLGINDLQTGEICPHDTCAIPTQMGKEAKVILATVDSEFFYVWFDRVLKERTKLLVLPRMFEGNPIARRRRGHNTGNVSAAGTGQLNPSWIDVTPEMKEDEGPGGEQAPAPSPAAPAEPAAPDGAGPDTTGGEQAPAPSPAAPDGAGPDTTGGEQAPAPSPAAPAEPAAPDGAGPDTTGGEQAPAPSPAAPDGAGPDTTGGEQAPAPSPAAPDGAGPDTTTPGDDTRGAEYNEVRIVHEGISGKDQLDYDRYAQALGDLFRTGERDVLPVAVGIFAPWGAGKSFLLDLLRKNLRGDEESTTPGLRATLCCCFVGLLHMMWQSTLLIILRVAWGALTTWFRSCWAASSAACCDSSSSRLLSDIESGREKGGSRGRSFIFVEFNAWEYARSDVLWAALISKIFDAVEGHPDFGPGVVRVARIAEVLQDPTWNWSGLASLYTVATVVGIIAVVVFNVIDDIGYSVDKVTRWIVAVLGVPGVSSLLALFFQMRPKGRLGTAQGVLRRAASNKKSVGEVHHGFMSEVKDELEILFKVMNNKRAGDGATFALTVTVDDLDRCPDTTIMEMLAAIHLLLQQRDAPMAVFLAVDPQLIISAILRTKGAETKMKAMQYLDKIIHIPFCLPRTSKEDRLKYLNKLLHNNSCRKTLSQWLTQVTNKDDQNGRKNVVNPIPSSDLVTWKRWELPVPSDEAIPLLAKFPSALELVWRLKEFPDVMTSIQRAAFGDFMEGLKNVASNKMTRSAKVEMIDGMFEELNSVINTIGKMGGVARQEEKDSFSSTGDGVGDGGVAWLPPGASKDEPARRIPTGSDEDGKLDNSVNSIEGSQRRPSESSMQASPPLGGNAAASNEEQSSSSSTGDGGDDPISADPETNIRAISPEEDAVFRRMFEIVQATPRKIKRVVNLYFLLRSVALKSSEESTALWMKGQSRKLVTWTMLAEFWPFRVSCILCAIAKGAPTDKLPQDADGDILADWYQTSYRDSKSVQQWVKTQGMPRRKKKDTADFCSFDLADEDFVQAMTAGAELTTGEAINYFLQHSFNLNPAIMPSVELAMADNPVKTYSDAH